MTYGQLLGWVWGSKKPYGLRALQMHLAASWTALNQVHFDKVEERSARIRDSEATLVEPIRKAATEGKDKLSLVEQAQLNASLLFDNRAASFGPGRLYAFEQIEALCLGKALPDNQDVLCDTLEINHLERAPDLPVVFPEVSAACDHQQEKIRTAQLLGGVVFPSSTLGEGEKKKRVNARRARSLART